MGVAADDALVLVGAHMLPDQLLCLGLFALGHIEWLLICQWPCKALEKVLVDNSFGTRQSCKASNI